MELPHGSFSRSSADGGAAADTLLATAAVGAEVSVGDFLGRGATPVRLPHQLPIYLTRESFLPTSGQVADFGAPLAEYGVLDDMIVAPEFERYLVVAWGDRVFDDRDQYVGFNATTPRSAGSTAPATASCG